MLTAAQEGRPPHGMDNPLEVSGATPEVSRAEDGRGARAEKKRPSSGKVKPK